MSHKIYIYFVEEYNCDARKKMERIQKELTPEVHYKIERTTMEPQYEKSVRIYFRDPAGRDFVEPADNTAPIIIEHKKEVILYYKMFKDIPEIYEWIQTIPYPVILGRFYNGYGDEFLEGQLALTIKNGFIE